MSHAGKLAAGVLLALHAALVACAPSTAAQTPDPCSVFACPTRTVTPGPNGTNEPPNRIWSVPMPTWFPTAFAVLVLVVGSLWAVQKWVLDPFLRTLNDNSVLSTWKRKWSRQSKAPRRRS